MSSIMPDSIFPPKVMSSLSSMLTDSIFPPKVTSWRLITIGGVVTCFYIYMTSFRNKNKKFPPTPGMALPVIGHLHILQKDQIEQYRQWRKSLGDIFMFKLGSYSVVVINGHRLLKEVFHKQADVFSDRPTTLLENSRKGITRGLIWSSGPLWKEQRTSALAILREFGMGKNGLAENVKTEVEIYLKELESYNGEPVDLKRLTFLSVSNVISAILFGERFELYDPVFIKMTENVNKCANFGAKRRFLILFPWLKYLPFDFENDKEFSKSFNEILDSANNLIKQKMEQFDNPTMSSFIDAFTQEIIKKKESGNKTYLDKHNLEQIIFDLFIAGTETTANVILWCYIFVIQNPGVQEKIFEEINVQIGLDRAATMEDKPKMKYLGAVILETFRKGNILPLSLQHSTKRDAIVDGYTIPKDFIVVPNLDSVLMDEDVWEDPESFRPERFLDSEGNLQSKEELLPFSLGRRVCLGESLARMELFLFLTSVFQKFKLSAEDFNNFDVKPMIGITRGQMPFKLRCEAR